MRVVVAVKALILQVRPPSVEAASWPFVPVAMQCADVGQATLFR